MAGLENTPSEISTPNSGESLQVSSDHNPELHRYLKHEGSWLPGQELYRLTEARRSLTAEYLRTLSWTDAERIGNCNGYSHTIFSMSEFSSFVTRRLLEDNTLTNDHSNTFKEILHAVDKIPPHLVSAVDIPAIIMQSSETDSPVHLLRKRLKQTGERIDEDTESILENIVKIAETVPSETLSRLNELRNKVLCLDQTVTRYGLKDYEIGIAVQTDKNNENNTDARLQRNIEVVMDAVWSGQSFTDDNAEHESVKPPKIIDIGFGWTSWTTKQIHKFFKIACMSIPSPAHRIFRECSKKYPENPMVLFIEHVPGFPGARLRANSIKLGWEELKSLISPLNSAKFFQEVLYGSMFTKTTLVDGLKNGLFILNPLDVLHIGHSFAGARLNELLKILPFLRTILLNPAILPIDYQKNDVYQGRFKLISSFLKIARHLDKNVVGIRQLNMLITKELSRWLMGPGDPESLENGSMFPLIYDQLCDDHVKNLTDDPRIPASVVGASLDTMTLGACTPVLVPPAIVTSTDDRLTHETTVESNLIATAQLVVQSLKDLGIIVDQNTLILIMRLAELKGGHMEFLDPSEMGFRRIIRKGLEQFNLLNSAVIKQLADYVCTRERVIKIVTSQEDDSGQMHSTQKARTSDVESLSEVSDNLSRLELLIKIWSKLIIADDTNRSLIQLALAAKKAEFGVIDLPDSNIFTDISKLIQNNPFQQEFTNPPASMTEVFCRVSAQVLQSGHVDLVTSKDLQSVIYFIGYLTKQIAEVVQSSADGEYKAFMEAKNELSGICGNKAFINLQAAISTVQNAIMRSRLSGTSLPQLDFPINQLKLSNQLLLPIVQTVLTRKAIDARTEPAIEYSLNLALSKTAPVLESLGSDEISPENWKLILKSIVLQVDIELSKQQNVLNGVSNGLDEAASNFTEIISENCPVTSASIVNNWAAQVISETIRNYMRLSARSV